MTKEESKENDINPLKKINNTYKSNKLYPYIRTNKNKELINTTGNDNGKENHQKMKKNKSTKQLEDISIKKNIPEQNQSNPKMKKQHSSYNVKQSCYTENNIIENKKLTKNNFKRKMISTDNKINDKTETSKDKGAYTKITKSKKIQNKDIEGDKKPYTLLRNRTNENYNTTKDNKANISNLDKRRNYNVPKVKKKVKKEESKFIEENREEENGMEDEQKQLNMLQLITEQTKLFKNTIGEENNKKIKNFEKKKKFVEINGFDIGSDDDEIDEEDEQEEKKNNSIREDVVDNKEHSKEKEIKKSNEKKGTKSIKPIANRNIFIDIKSNIQNYSNINTYSNNNNNNNLQNGNLNMNISNSIEKMNKKNGGIISDIKNCDKNKERRKKSVNVFEYCEKIRNNLDQSKKNYDYDDENMMVDCKDSLGESFRKSNSKTKKDDKNFRKEVKNMKIYKLKNEFENIKDNDEDSGFNIYTKKNKRTKTEIQEYMAIKKRREKDEEIKNEKENNVKNLNRYLGLSKLTEIEKSIGDKNKIKLNLTNNKKDNIECLYYENNSKEKIPNEYYIGYKRKSSDVSRSTESSQSTIINEKIYYKEICASKNIYFNKNKQQDNINNEMRITTKDKDIQNTYDINVTNKMTTEGCKNETVEEEKKNKNNLNRDLFIKCEEALDKANNFFAQNKIEKQIINLSVNKQDIKDIILDKNENKNNKEEDNVNKIVQGKKIEKVKEDICNEEKKEIKSEEKEEKLISKEVKKEYNFTKEELENYEKIFISLKDYLDSLSVKNALNDIINYGDMRNSYKYGFSQLIILLKSYPFNILRLIYQQQYYKDVLRQLFNPYIRRAFNYIHLYSYFEHNFSEMNKVLEHIYRMIFMKRLIFYGRFADKKAKKMIKIEIFENFGKKLTILFFKRFLHVLSEFKKNENEISINSSQKYNTFIYESFSEKSSLTAYPNSEGSAKLHKVCELLEMQRKQQMEDNSQNEFNNLSELIDNSIQSIKSSDNNNNNKNNINNIFEKYSDIRNMPLQKNLIDNNSIKSNDKGKKDEIINKEIKNEEGLIIPLDEKIGKKTEQQNEIKKEKDIEIKIDEKENQKNENLPMKIENEQYKKIEIDSGCIKEIEISNNLKINIQKEEKEKIEKDENEKNDIKISNIDNNENKKEELKNVEELNQNLNENIHKNENPEQKEVKKEILEVADNKSRNNQNNEKLEEKIEKNEILEEKIEEKVIEKIEENVIEKIEKNENIIEKTEKNEEKEIKNLIELDKIIVGINDNLNSISKNNSSISNNINNDNFRYKINDSLEENLNQKDGIKDDKSIKIFSQLSEKNIENLTTELCEKIVTNIIQAEIKGKSKALFKKKKEINSSLNNSSTSLMVSQNSISIGSHSPGRNYSMNKNVSLANNNDAYQTISSMNNSQNESLLNNSVFMRTVNEIKKEKTLNLYNSKIVPLLVDRIENNLWKNYDKIVDNLKTPLKIDEPRMINGLMLKDKALSVTSKIRFCNDEIKKIKYIDEKVLTDFESINKEIRNKDNIVTDNYYDKILNKCVYDTSNELIEKYRQYGIIGQPLSWSIRTKDIDYKYKRNDKFSKSIFINKIIKELKSIIETKMGLIAENYDYMDMEQLNQDRDNKFMESIKQELKDNEDYYQIFETQETYVKLSLSRIIMDQLLNEIVEILEHVQYSRKEPQKYQSKSIYACEDIPRLSFQPQTMENNYTGNYEGDLEQEESINQ